MQGLLVAPGERGAAGRRLHCIALHTAAVHEERRPSGQPPRWTTRGHDTRRATPCGAGGSLSPEQVAAHVRDGFLLVSGLLGDVVLASAVDAMWTVMAEPQLDNNDGRPGSVGDSQHAAGGLSRDEPSTWTADWDGRVTSPAILETFTPEWLRAANLLAAANAREALFPVADWHQATRPQPTDLSGSVARGYPHAINKFPTVEPGLQDGPPVECSPHCDYGDVGDKGWRVDPQPIPIQVQTPAPPPHLMTPKHAPKYI